MVLPTSIADYERLAQKTLPVDAWSYLSHGSGRDVTIRENIAAFDRIWLKGRVLADLTGANTAVTLLGEALAHPILLAPAAGQRRFHDDGEVATVRGASSAQALTIVSNNSSVPIEDIARAAGNSTLWCQLYIQRDRGLTSEYVKRVETAGYRALVVTGDTVALPENVSLGGAASPLFGESLGEHPTWKDIEWLHGLTRLPLLIKGVMTPEDARLAVAQQVAGIIVSNHGGRILDTLPATVTVLPGIVDSVAGSMPVLVDGGVRSGADIVKALALGAAAVLVGRPYLYGLSVSGSVGVAHVLRLLRGQLEIAMTLTGCPTVKTINRSTLVPTRVLTNVE